MQFWSHNNFCNNHFTNHLWICECLCNMHWYCNLQKSIGETWAPVQTFNIHLLRITETHTCTCTCTCRSSINADNTTQKRLVGIIMYVPYFLIYTCTCKRLPAGLEYTPGVHQVSNWGHGTLHMWRVYM